MELEIAWFILLAILLAGYAVLDGFDLGVGIIHPLLREPERDVSIRAIGPLWDGNEVWLVTFGGALFAAFPEAYATILSAFYLPVMLLLCCLIFRAATVDFRNKLQSRFWKRMCDTGFFCSSLGATFVFGIAAGNLLRGIAIGSDGEFSGNTTDFLNLYSLLAGGFAVVTFALHGFAFLILKTTAQMKLKLSQWVWHFWGVFLVAYILLTIMTLIEHDHVVDRVRSSWWAIPVVIFNVLAIANIPRTLMQGAYGQAFASSSVNICCLVSIFFLSVFPDIVVDVNFQNSLSIHDAASSESTLMIMLIIALIGMPMVVAYTAIVYWTFRQPIEVTAETAD